MEIREIGSGDELEEIREDWQDLYEKCPWATPFQSPDWLVPWWRCLGSGSLLVLAAYRGRDLIGIAPLYAQRNDRSQLEVRFLGTGISDYLDFICEPDFLHLVIPRLLDHLWEIRDQWDLCSLQELRQDSPLLQMHFPFSPAPSFSQTGVCPVVTLPLTADSYMGALADKLRSSLREAEKKLAPFSVEFATREEVSQELETLFLAHGMRWEGHSPPETLSRAEFQCFHRNAAAAFAQRGGLGLYTLRSGQRICAVLYGFRKAPRFYAYLSGFDADLEDLSPEVLLTWSVMLDALNSGFREFDFLRGSEPYKYLWGAKDTVNYQLTVTKN